MSAQVESSEPRGSVAPPSPDRERPHYLEVVPDQPAPASSPEQTPASGEAAGQSAPEASDAASGARWRQEARRFAAQMAGTFTPPDFLNEDRPSLRKLYGYGRFTTSVPAAGMARAASIGWASGVAIPTAVAGYGLAWAGERAARMSVLAPLVTLLALWDPTRVALSVLLYPLALLLDVITNYPGVL